MFKGKDPARPATNGGGLNSVLGGGSQMTGKVRIEGSGVDSEFFALLQIELLQRGGYPFGPNDLDPDTWMCLGVLAEERERSWRTISGFASQRPI